MLIVNNITFLLCYSYQLGLPIPETGGGGADLKQGSLPNLTDLAIGQHNNGANPTDSIQSSIPGGPPGSGSILQNNEESPISSVSELFKCL